VIAGHEFLVARQNPAPPPFVRGLAQPRFGYAFGGNGQIFAVADIAKLAVPERFIQGLFDLRLGPANETLPIA